MKFLWRSLLLLLLTIAMILAIAPFTERGSQALLQAADRYSPLDIVYAGGSLAGELRI